MKPIIKQISEFGFFTDGDMPAISVYHFNKSGQIVLEEHQDYSIEHHYLADGNKYESLEYNGNILIEKTVYDYDDEGDLLGIKVYDGFGDLKRIDVFNWMKSGRVAYIESTKFLNYLPASRSFKRIYYRKDNQIAFSSHDGETEKNEYDPEGKLVRSTVKLDNQSESIVTEYDSFGRVICIKPYDRSIGDLRFEYEYDENGLWTNSYSIKDNGERVLFSKREINYY
ncbi:MAG: hypothetical protein J6Y06_08010 [Bacteroidales bacterium]|nr:hypothetical protein [Bacteroidales bacterium]